MASCMASAIAHLQENSSCQDVSQLIRAMPRWRAYAGNERVRASISRFLTNKLRLKVNEAKSAVARPEERKFLGFSIANDGSERRIAPKALDKFNDRIREITRRA